MMNKAKYILAVLLATFCLSVNAKDYYASRFGIESNGTTLNTRSIQRAIDYISENGGGRLVFRVGRYLTGSIHLKSNVTLYLSEGAVLVGSANPYDYDKSNGWIALIFANKVNNIAIDGKGVIDGQGRVLANNFMGQALNGIIKDTLELGRNEERAKLIYFRECSKALVRNVTLQNPSFWTQTYDQCRHLTIDGITVRSRAYWNNDGMDVVDCDSAVIRNCFVDATDDGICLKSHSSKSMNQHILIYNNVITSSASAIKFGTASYGGFKHIRIINNKVYDTFRSAIAIEAVDGGWIEDVEVDSLQATNTGNPLFLVVGERRKGRRSHMENIYVHNMTCEVPAGKPDVGVDFEGPTNERNPRNTSPAEIIGMKNNPVHNVRLENITLLFPGGGNPNFAKVGLNELDKVPELYKSYPEYSQYKELPAWGLYIWHAEDVSLKNVTLKAQKSDYRVAIVADDVKGLSLSKMKYAEPGKKSSTQVFMRNTTKK